MNKKGLIKRITAIAMVCFLLMSVIQVVRMSATAYAADRRSEIEACLYNEEYYAKANEDVAVALNNNKEALYNHWLTYGMAEGRNASMVFNAKYYLEVNQDVAAAIGEENYVGAYEHFVKDGLLEGRESSPVFSVKYYLEANTDVAQAFNGDYVSAAKHFNENAIAEGRSGSGNFDYTVYRACNTDVEELYDDYIEGYYIHYINHGRAEGRTGGLANGDSGNAGGSTGSDETVDLDKTAASYRIFDAEYYLEQYPELELVFGTEKDVLYQYWLDEGISMGQTASPVIVPEEYLELNSDVAEAFGDDYAAALNHFLNYGIYEGRTGSYEFDYSIYADCNTDVGDVFADDIVGYYFHYVEYGKDENRTAAVYVPEVTPSVTPSPTPTVAPSITPSVTPSVTPEVTPSVTPEVTPSVTPEVTPSITPEDTPSVTPEVTPAVTPSVTPSVTPEATPTVTPEPTPTTPAEITLTDEEGITYVLSFDESGTMLEQSYYDGETLLGTNVFNYDEEGTRTSIVFRASDGSELGTLTYAYEEESLKQTTEEITGGAVRYIENYSVSEEEAEAKVVLAENLSKTVAEYDENSNISTKLRCLYYANGTLKEEEKCDGQGNRIYLNQYDSKGDLYIDLGEVEF